MRLGRLVAALAVASALAGGAGAASLRIASGNDPQSFDPHSLALLYQSRVVSQIYESLVNRDREFKLEPSLALSWQAVDARTWRFKLRPNVRFHDGSPFTADDAVFSIERALMKTSQRAFQLRGVTGARKVDDLTIDVVMSAPDAVLPEKFLLLGMMSKLWAQKHGVLAPQDYNAKQETYAVRNANGTGPYKLKSYESDNRTVLVAHDGWWGKRGNVDEATLRGLRNSGVKTMSNDLADLTKLNDDYIQSVQHSNVKRFSSPRYRMKPVMVYTCIRLLKH